MLRIFICALIATLVSGCASHQKLMTSLTDKNLHTAKEMVDAGFNPFFVNESGESAVSLGLKAKEGSDIRTWAEQLARASEEEARALLDNLQSANPMSIEALRLRLEDPTFYLDASVNNYGGAILHELSLSPKTVKFMRPLIQSGATLDQKSDDGWTPLMLAVFGGNVQAAQTLIAAGADLEPKDDTGWTALHFTANKSKTGNRDNDVELASLLLDAGANQNAQANDESTPLHLSVAFNRPDVREFLINAGADFNMAADGWTPLMKAVFDGNVQTAQALIAAGADLEAKSDKGWTALHYTANNPDYGNRDNDVELATLLLDAGANPNIQRNDEMTPLYLSVALNRPDVRDLLINAGADLNMAADGWTPLIQAVFDGNVQTAQALIAAGADLEAKGDKGWTALHFTANTSKNGNRDSDAELAKLLIAAGADLNSLTIELATPLMFAAIHDRRNVATVLLDQGARTDLEHKYGRTALQEAKREDSYRVAALIREHMMGTSSTSSTSQSP